MRDPFLWLCGCLLLAAVATAGCRSPEKIELAEPLVLLEFLDEDPVKFGQLRDTRLIVVNTTIQPLLLRAVIPQDQLPFHLELMTSLRGRVQQREALDCYDLYPGFPQSTPDFFSDDTLLLPGEQTSFSPVLIRTRFSSQPITVWYQSFSFHAMLKNAYFPDVRRRRTTKQRFDKIPYSRLHDYRTGEPGTLDRCTLLPDLETLGPVLMSVTEFDMPLEDHGTRGSLVALCGSSTSSTVTRWHGGELWIIDDAEAGTTHGFREGEPKVPLPRCELLAFDLFDRVPEFMPSVTVIHANGLRSELTSPEEVRALLERARKAGERLIVESFENDAEITVSVVVIKPPEPKSEPD